MRTAAKTGYGETLHVKDFKRMIQGATFFFEREVDRINSLNVFPVPDGDTGTNMIMTLKAAAEGSNSYNGQSVGELSEVIASKALMGARGNSGVILSQILRGIARGLRRKEHISPVELSKAFQYGVVYAYKAVSKPVEGTILTVAREMARGIYYAVRKGDNLFESMEQAIKSGKKALDKTTDMLPALKEAGVVDAGGLGLLVFVEGCLFTLKRSLAEMLPYKNAALPESTASTLIRDIDSAEKLNLENPYCTEMIIKRKAKTLDGLKGKLSGYGSSLLVATDKNIAKIHIHTATPGLVLQTALEYGSLHDIKIENMHDQHQQTAAPSSFPVESAVILPGPDRQEVGETGIISVSFGEGFREIFLSLGTDEIVFGGQTMNPNVKDLLSAVENLPQDSAIILPNNKNIILVAEQVKDLSDKHVEVLETKTLPEGLAALLAYNPQHTLIDNVKAMKENLKPVTTGLVTYATRDAIIKGEEIKHGQYLGLANDEVITIEKKLEDAALNLAKNILAKKKDIITIFYGHDINRKDASVLAEAIKEDYPELEIELQYGGQPLYYYIFSVE